MKPLLSNTLIIFSSLIALSSSARAQSISTVQTLSFGTIVIADPNSVSEITVNTAADSFSTNANTYTLISPQRGEYLVTGGPANSPFTVMTSPASNDLGGPDSQVLTMDNMTIHPGTHMTDGAGEATFYIGGRLQSDGSGNVYNDGTYNDSYNITIAF